MNAGGMLRMCKSNYSKKMTSVPKGAFFPPVLPRLQANTAPRVVYYQAQCTSYRSNFPYRQLSHGSGDGDGVGPAQEASRAMQHALARPAAVACNHRARGRHRFQRHNSKVLILRRRTHCP